MPGRVGGVPEPGGGAVEEDLSRVLARIAPVRILTSVDLPAPFSPSSACTVPGATRRSHPFSAVTPPYDFLIPTASMTCTA